MTPTAFFRWYVYLMGGDGTHLTATQIGDSPYARVLQQWWHQNGEPPPSSYGEWRDIPQEWCEPNIAIEANRS